MSDTDTPFPSASAAAEAPLRGAGQGRGAAVQLPWRLDRRFTSAKSKMVAAVLIIAAFPAGSQVADLIRLHRFRSALQFTAIAVEVDGRRYAIPPTDFATAADLRLSYAFLRDRYFTLLGAHDERVTCYYAQNPGDIAISFVPKDLRTNACLGKVARFWPELDGDAGPDGADAPRVDQ